MVEYRDIVKHIEGFDQEYRLVDKLVLLDNLLHIDLKTAADIHVADEGSGRAVELDAKACWQYDSRHQNTLLKHKITFNNRDIYHVYL